MSRAAWVLVLLAAACTLPPAADRPSSEPSSGPPGEVDGESATLVRVDDGDSFVALVNGEERRVRMIGVNAPEQGECLAEEAKDRLAQLLAEGPFVLVEDVEPLDRFDRLLRYVYAGSTFVNEAMAAEGLVVARPFEPNTSLQSVLDEAEDAARDAGRGLWDPTACGSVDANLAITWVESDPPGRDLDGEYVEIENLGSAVDLTGWSIRDETSQNRYEFPDGATIQPDQRLRIYSGCGTDTAAALFWCSDRPIWDNAGDTAFLVSPTGSIQASRSYGR